MSAKIPVFVSAPTALSPDQKGSYAFLLELLENEGLEQRTLGQTDFGVDCPLNEVYSIARHCSGGMILGYEQMHAPHVESKRETPHSATLKDVSFPTPWNNLEAGLLFGLKLPLLVFRQKGVIGGVFDLGVSNIFIQDLPACVPSPKQASQIGIVVKHWASKVRETYRAY